MAENRSKLPTGTSKDAENMNVRGVSLSPLLTDKGPDELAKNVFRLFYFMGVKPSDILQILVNTAKGFATVNVRTEECERYLVAVFQEPATVMDRFDLRRITHDPRQFSAVRVSERTTPSQDMHILANNSGNEGEDSLRQATTGSADKTVPCKPNDLRKRSGSRKRNSERVLLNADSKLISQSGVSSTSTVSDSHWSSGSLGSEIENVYKKEPQMTRPFIPSTLTNQRVSSGVKQNEKVNKRRASVERTQLHVGTDKTEGLNMQHQSRCHHRKPEKSIFPYKMFESPFEERKDRQSAGILSANVNHSKGSKTKVSEPAKQAPAVSTSAQSSAAFSPSPSASGSQAVSPSGNVSDAVAKLNAKTSTPAVPACGCPETVFYHLQQHIGTETRHAEFKRGGIIFEQGLFRSLVGKYVCGFLNSEGGTIYFGVTDDGKVLGIEVDSYLEEELRRDVEFAVRSLLEPSVDSSEYSVNFARVMAKSGRLIKDLRVMEVCVKPRWPQRRQRFSSAGVVYLRRDGSLQAVSRASDRVRT